MVCKGHHQGQHTRTGVKTNGLVEVPTEAFTRPSCCSSQTSMCPPGAAHHGVAPCRLLLGSRPATANLVLMGCGTAAARTCHPICCLRLFSNCSALFLQQATQGVSTGCCRLLCWGCSAPSWPQSTHAVLVQHTLICLVSAASPSGSSAGTCC
jgi:hypothetical protein